MMGKMSLEGHVGTRKKDDEGDGGKRQMVERLEVMELLKSMEPKEAVVVKLEEMEVEMV
jgi:hypothetical protein